MGLLGAEDVVVVGTTNLTHALLGLLGTEVVLAVTGRAWLLVQAALLEAANFRADLLALNVIAEAGGGQEARRKSVSLYALAWMLWVGYIDFAVLCIEGAEAGKQNAAMMLTSDERLAYDLKAGRKYPLDCCRTDAAALGYECYKLLVIHVILK